MPPPQLGSAMEPVSRQEPQQRLYSPTDVAAYLGVTAKTVYSWSSQGRVPCVKFGKTVRFDIRDLDAWIAACRHPTVDQWFQAWKEGRLVRGRIVPPRPIATLANLEVKPPPPRRLLNVHETALYLCVSANTIYEWARDGTIGHVRFRGRGHLRFRLDDLEEFIRVNHHRRKRRVKTKRTISKVELEAFVPEQVQE